MIIHSLLDTDLYKFTMQQAVFHRFPEASAEYRFALRSGGIDFRAFADEIRAEVDAFCSVRLQPDEIAYLRTIPYLRDDYIDSLRRFKLSPDAVEITTEPHFDLRVRGNWYQTILFEVPVLAIVNEVYCRRAYPLTRERHSEGEHRLAEKCRTIRQADVAVRISEFGTRRRYSRDWQTFVIDKLAAEIPDVLLGTSNVYDARRLGIMPVGTMGHEFLQAFQVFAPLPQSQRMALHAWLEEFRGALGVALSDVISRDAFLADFDLLFAKAYDGARQDSGDPLEWGDRLIEHYRKLGIDPMTKIAVFTDSLTIDRALEIARYFAGRIRTSFGIGTHLTNDFDFDAPQIVIKMVRCDGWPVAKLSDSPGKSICDDALYLAYLRKVFAPTHPARNGAR
jgi:nicotinate phosphoribosyltransferase